MTVIIHFRDGSRKDFPHEPRPGGSYTNKVRYEGGMVIVTNAWDREFAYPMDMVKSVETTPTRF